MQSTKLYVMRYSSLQTAEYAEVAGLRSHPFLDKIKRQHCAVSQHSSTKA